MDLLTIAHQKEGKGRSFHANLLAYVTADGLWEGGRTNTEDTRPVWVMFANADAELKSFVANLQMGRKALFPNPQKYPHPEIRIELLKTGGYQYAWQKEAEGTIVRAYLPDLMISDPGMVEVEGAAFLLLPTRAWVEDQGVDVGPLVEHGKALYPDVPEDTIVSLARICYLFAVYLDRRIRCPLYTDGRFYLQVLLACLKEGLASLSQPKEYYYGCNAPFGVHRHLGFRERHTDAIGLYPGIAFRASHETIEKILAEQITIFFDSKRVG